jgi:hypothetical protein
MALAKAYQQYGGYVVDTAGDRTDNLAYLENGATPEQVAHLQADVATIRAHLALLTNGTADNPGGPGTPIVDNGGGGNTAPVTTAPVTPDPVPVTPDPVQPPTSDNGGSSSGGNTAGAGTHADGFSTTIGRGPDSLVIKISEDAYQGDAKYQISVDGKKIGGTLTAHAAHADGASDTITVHGNWGAGSHDVMVRFLNDAWGGNDAADRNLYVDGATYNGVAVSGAQSVLAMNGPDWFTFVDTGSSQASGRAGSQAQAQAQTAATPINTASTAGTATAPAASSAADATGPSTDWWTGSHQATDGGHFHFAHGHEYLS